MIVVCLLGGVKWGRPPQGAGRRLTGDSPVAWHALALCRAWIDPDDPVLSAGAATVRAWVVTTRSCANGRSGAGGRRRSKRANSVGGWLAGAAFVLMLALQAIRSEGRRV